MTDIDALLSKVSAFHKAVVKDSDDKDNCPEGQKMVDGECVADQDSDEAQGQEKSMTEAPKPPEKTVEKKPEEQPKPAPAVPTPAAEAKTDPRIEALEANMKTTESTLNSIAEKLSGLVLNAEIKGQSETLKALIDQNKKMAEALTAAQPPAPLPSRTMVPAKLETMDLSQGGSSRGMSIEDRAARFAKQWGLEIKEPEEIELTKTPPEVSPTEAKLTVLEQSFAAQAKALQGIQDQLSGLVTTLSRAPNAPVAPASPSAPVIPLVGKEKRSVQAEGESYETIDWSTDMNHGGSITDRAQVLAQKLGFKESA